MTKEEKKELLSRYKQLDMAINQKTEEYFKLRAICEKVTTTFYKTPKGKSDLQNTIARMVDLQGEINFDLASFIDTKTEIEMVIQTIPDQTLQTVLRLKYINGKTFAEIADQVNYSRRHVIRLFESAVEKLEI